MKKFKNDQVQIMVEWLETNRDHFTKKKLGRGWRGMYETLALAFPEDRGAMIEILAGESKAKKREIPTGGARITRLTPDADTVQVVQGCKDCPGSATKVATSPGTLRRAVVGKSKPVAVPGPDLVDEAAGETTGAEWTDDLGQAFTSPDDVFQRFDGDGEMMIKYAESAGINVGRATNPKTLAGKIFINQNARQEEE